MEGFAKLFSCLAKLRLCYVELNCGRVGVLTIETCTLNSTSRFWWGAVIFVMKGVKQSQLLDFESWSSLATKKWSMFHELKSVRYGS